jgi:hypothetical protein
VAGLDSGLVPGDSGGVRVALVHLSRSKFPLDYDPTLRIGDLIFLVNKFHYGLRMPVFTTKLWANNDPARRCDGVRYPPPPAAQPWTTSKRVVGVPWAMRVFHLNGSPSTVSCCPNRRPIF